MPKWFIMRIARWTLVVVLMALIPLLLVAVVTRGCG